MPEDNSYEFTAKRQPGNKYRKPYKSGSCFAAGTKVLMGDGTTKNIELIVSGDIVATPDGPWEVLAVATPPRRGRTLYSLDSTIDIQFTATHPLLSKTPSRDERYTCIDPEKLKDLVPLVADHGVAPLVSGSSVSAWDQLTQSITAYTVSIINEHVSTNPDEVVYDVIVAPDDTTFHTPPYIVVSNSGVQLLIASEIPPFETIPRGTLGTIQIFSNSLPDLVNGLQDVSTGDLDDHMEVILHGITANIIHHTDALRDNIAAYVPNADPLADQIATIIFGGANQYHSFGGEIYDRVFAGLVEEILAISEINPDTYVSIPNDNQDMSLAVSILHFDAGQIPGVFAADLSSIKVTWHDTDGAELDEVFVIQDSEAKYSTKFVHRFYKTLYFPAYDPEKHHLYKLAFELQLKNGAKLYSTLHVPDLSDHTARFATAIVLNEKNGIARAESGRLGLMTRFIPTHLTQAELNSQQVTVSTQLDNDLVQSIGDAIALNANFSHVYLSLNPTNDVSE